MLVLSRKAGESIVIGNDIVITVVAHHGEQVRIGIQAPSDVTIHREEVYLKIKKEATALAAVIDKATAELCTASNRVQ